MHTNKHTDIGPLFYRLSLLLLVLLFIFYFIFLFLFLFYSFFFLLFSLFHCYYYLHEGSYVFGAVCSPLCWDVCGQNYAKTPSPIFMNIDENFLKNRQRRNILNFGANPSNGYNSWLLFLAVVANLLQVLPQPPKSCSLLIALREKKKNTCQTFMKPGGRVLS